MTLEHLSTTLQALQEAHVRFLIAGGLAVIAYGHTRVTHDLDIVLALEHENTQAAIDTLLQLGFKPRIPVAAHDFCDHSIRQNWIETKNLQVFSMINEPLGGLVIDIFATEPFDFPKEWNQAVRMSLPGFPADLPFISKDTLLQMKRQAGRPIDLDDVKHLEMSDES